MNQPGLEQGTQAPGITEFDRLEAKVRCRLNGRDRNFRLVVRGNGLVLQGTTHTYFAKQLVQHVILERGFRLRPTRSPCLESSGKGCLGRTVGRGTGVRLRGIRFVSFFAFHFVSSGASIPTPKRVET